MKRDPSTLGVTEEPGVASRVEAPVRFENIILSARKLTISGRATDIVCADPCWEKIGAKMEGARKMLSFAADSAAVLILGETGTGKELVARGIHNSFSAGSRGSFVAINAGALAETLVESELFGHERGAFTGAVRAKPGAFEQARGGTLFLDEIGELSPASQIRLLRVIQERRVKRVGGDSEIPVANIRLILATHRNLGAMVEEGQFRKDLWYRINGYDISLPPLRERPADIPVLAAFFLEKARRVAMNGDGQALEGFSPETMKLLQQHTWPGNARELENAMMSAFLSTGEDVWLRPDHLPEPLLRRITSRDRAVRISTGIEEEVARTINGKTKLPTLKEMRGVLEGWYARHVLGLTDGNVGEATTVLGVSRKTLSRLLDDGDETE